MSTTAIVGGTLIDGTGRDPVSNATVVIEDARIVAAGRCVDPPRDARVIP